VTGMIVDHSTFGRVLVLAAMGEADIAELRSRATDAEVRGVPFTFREILDERPPATVRAASLLLALQYAEKLEPTADDDCMPY